MTDRHHDGPASAAGGGSGPPAQAFLREASPDATLFSDRPADGPLLTAIAAVAANGVIGDGAGLPWRLPEDFARFKAVTMGGVLVMGRRTFDSLGGPLPGRQSVVLSRAAGADVVYCPWSDGGPRDLAGLLAAGAEPVDAAGRCPAPPPGGPPALGAGVLVAASVDLALGLLAWYPGRTWWSAGGGQVYAALWPCTTDLDLTEVQASVPGPVRFPPVDPVYWIETRREARDGFDFVGYRRRAPDAGERLARLTAATAPPGLGDA